jgi:F/Y-rich N-terminus/PHD-like zinc-binding domain/PHD-finger
LENIFKKMAKAAHPGKYTKRIEEYLAKAEEAKKNEEERVQVDESVEKKDLVVGSSAVVSITLPKLRDSPPDVASCVPFREVKLKPLDAFFCSWMECCFTCGSSGAADTLLFCVDCGEAFHSFCVSAPVHSMEPSSVAGWRCPNCKICEISGDVPADETRMLFCEMCDRGFSLDLVDPPLTAAPTGLWVCGQCVDCKHCSNKEDDKGVSLKHWSQDPERCFRCGGCDGLDAQISEGKCQVCAITFLANDKNVVICQQCDSKVHIPCDPRAQTFLDRSTTAQRATDTEAGAMVEEYWCPKCYKPTARSLEEVAKDTDRKFFTEQCRQLISDAKWSQDDHRDDCYGFSREEYQLKLMEEIEWGIRKQWRDEYYTIIRDAISIYCMAKTLGDPRFVIQQVLQRMHQLPPWLGHRALRFAVLAKRKQWDTLGYSNAKINVLVLTAKLAAAFIDIACRTLGINKEKDVSFPDRLEDLVIEPDVNGEVVLPSDRLKEAKNAVKVDESGNIVGDDESQTKPSPGKQLQQRQKKEMGSVRRDLSKYKMAEPLCGWNSVNSSANRTEWSDPRECCLCHLCGDVDAGLPDAAAPKQFGGLGRLLPMTDGLWVHTYCALWSSEVWEAPDDGLIHAVEKARGRGSQLKCFGCGFSGATVGCNKSNCPYNYHLPCARACGAVFTASQQVFCASHKASATEALVKDHSELMKALMVAPDKQKQGTDRDPTSSTDTYLCFRIGSVIVHSLGTIESTVDGFHSEDYITPPGYVASRIFWSARYPRTRTVYILKIERNLDYQPQFVCIPGDDPTAKVTGRSAALVYNSLMDRVRKVNAAHFAQSDLYSKLPVVRRTRKKTFGLNGPQVRLTAVYFGNRRLHFSVSLLCS